MLLVIGLGLRFITVGTEIVGVDGPVEFHKVWLLFVLFGMRLMCIEITSTVVHPSLWSFFADAVEVEP